MARGQPSHRGAEHGGDERRPQRPTGDGDVERSDRVGGGLDQPFDRPDRRDRHGAAKQPPRRPVAYGYEPPSQRVQREHPAPDRVDHHEQARGVEERVLHPLHARVAEVEGVERERQDPQSEQRQGGEHEHRPARRERAFQPARRFGGGIAIDDAPRDPVNREGYKREQQHRPSQAEALRGRKTTADAGQPVPDSPGDRLDIGRNLARNAQPQLRIEDGGRARKRFARKQVATPRSDPGRNVVGFEQHGAGGAQVGVERVVFLLLGFQLRGRGVCRRRGVLVFGLGRQLGEALDRSGEPGRQVGDRRLQSHAERIVLRPEAQEIGVRQIRLLQCVLDAGQRVAGRIEVERPLVLRRGRKHPGKREREDGPAEKAQNRKRRHGHEGPT